MRKKYHKRRWILVCYSKGCEPPSDSGDQVSVSIKGNPAGRVSGIEF